MYIYSVIVTNKYKMQINVLAAVTKIIIVAEMLLLCLFRTGLLMMSKNQTPIRSFALTNLDCIVDEFSWLTKSLCAWSSTKNYRTRKRLEMEFYSLWDNGICLNQRIIEKSAWNFWQLEKKSEEERSIAYVYTIYIGRLLLQKNAQLYVPQKTSTFLFFK